MLNGTPTDDTASILAAIPQISPQALGMTEEEIQARVADEANNSKPVLLMLKRSVLTINKSIKNKKNLDLRVIQPTLTPEEQQQAEEQRRIDMTAVHLSKKIIISPYYKAITSHDVKTSTVVRGFAVPPHYNRGLFLIPLPEVFDVQKYLNKRMAERQGLVSQLVENYDIIVQEMEKVLGALYNYSDYPGKQEVLDKYSFFYKFFNFDVPLSLKEVNVALYEKEKANSDRYWEQVRQEVRLALVTSYQQLVKHMVDSLTPDEDGDGTKGKRYNIKSVKNVLKFMDQFQRKNSVSRDDELAKLIEKSKAVLSGVDINLINKDDNITQTILDEFTQVQNKLDERLEEFSTTQRRFNLFASEEV